MKLDALMAGHIPPFASCCCHVGGIALIARRRSRLALTLAEREDISRGIASDSSIREIARGPSPATSAVIRNLLVLR